MRSYSFFSIILLCVFILLLDAVTFYWLQSITPYLASPALEKAIHIAFWVFTLGLITAILVLKIRMAYIDPQRKQLLVSSLYGLTVSSFIPKLVFSIIISILYFTNYVFSEKESVLIVPLLGLVAGFLPFFVIVYAIFKGVYRFKVNHIPIEFEGLPENFKGIRIVHISDIHLGSFNAHYHIFDRAVVMINNLKPDFIFFTGDLVNNFAYELIGWKDTFNKLIAEKGKFSVLGNHDYGDYSEWESPEEKQANLQAIKDFQRDIGFRLLNNEAEVIEIDGQQIAVVGVENWGHPPFKQYGELQKALQNVTNIPFKILLSHDPSHWNEEVVAHTNIALTLSGHTHGMQAGLRYKTKTWSPIKYKYRQWAGLYQIASQYLYVNTGLGWLGFPGRLGMRPEITLIELQ